MVKFNILNQDIFLEKNNKFVIIDCPKYLEFLKVLLSVNNKEISNNIVEINGMQLNDKNSLVIDITSFSTFCSVVYGNARIKEEYIKLKLLNYKDRDKKQYIINNEILKIINDNYKGMFDNDILVDIDKLVKQYIQLNINDEVEFFNVLKYIIDNSQIKQFILLYSNSIIESLNIKRLLNNIDSDKLIKIEICDKNSEINKNDNIIFVQEMLYQIAGNEL